MITDKQKFRLSKEGFPEPVLNSMSFEQASDIISKLKPYHKQVNYPQTEFVESQKYKPKQEFKPKFDTSSYYVAYAKDLCVAMLSAHVEARKIDNKIEPLAINDLMTAAVEAIQNAKKAFI